jgi:hypothetical protein
LAQLMGAPHVPELPQPWIAALPEHSVDPGLQVPSQDAGPPSATHAEFVHATGLFHFPELSHVCTPWFEHSVDPGTHCPTHAPPTHAELAQGTAADHVPVGLQVSSPLFEHMVAAGVHDPTQAPLTQA